MKPSFDKVKVVEYDFGSENYGRTIRKDLFDVRRCEHTVYFITKDQMEYYIIFYDAEEGGAFNKTAKWLAKQIPVQPTGNFIILRIKYTEEDKEQVMDMDMTSVKAFLDFLKAY